MEHGLIISICLFLGVVGFAALILWLRDQGGPLWVAIEWTMWAVCALFGLTMTGLAIYNWRASIRAFQEANMLEVIGGIWLVWTGWQWLTNPGPGIEKQCVDFQSPELVEAVKRARNTFPYFVEQARRHIDGAYIRFPFVTDKEVTEHVWGYVHHYENGVFNVSPANEPYTQEKEFGKRRDVPESAVEDWQIMQADGRIKGAHTYIGAFQYLERNGVRLNRTMRKQKSQLADAERAVSTR